MRIKIVVGLFILFAVLAGLVVTPVLSAAPPVPTRRPVWPPGQPTYTPEPTATPLPTATPGSVCEITVSAEVVDDTVWQAGCIYIAPDGVWVAPGASLTILDGVTVLVGSWKTFHVYGTLYVEGTVDNPVVMDQQTADLSWTGLSFHGDSQPASDLVHLVVKGSYAGLAVISGSVWTTNCSFGGWREFDGR